MIFSITTFIKLHSKVSHATVLVTKHLAKITTLFLQYTYVLHI